MKYKIIEKEQYIKKPIIFDSVKWLTTKTNTIKNLLLQLNNAIIIKKWCVANTEVLLEVKQNQQIKYLWIKKGD